MLLSYQELKMSNVYFYRFLDFERNKESICFNYVCFRFWVEQGMCWSTIYCVFFIVCVCVHDSD